MITKIAYISPLSNHIQYSMFRLKIHRSFSHKLRHSRIFRHCKTKTLPLRRSISQYLVKIHFVIHQLGKEDNIKRIICTFPKSVGLSEEAILEFGFAIGVAIPKFGFPYYTLIYPILYNL